MYTLEIKREISYNNQQSVFHNVHNYPVKYSLVFTVNALASEW